MIDLAEGRRLFRLSEESGDYASRESKDWQDWTDQWFDNTEVRRGEILFDLAGRTQAAEARCAELEIELAAEQHAGRFSEEKRVELGDDYQALADSNNRTWKKYEAAKARCAELEARVREQALQMLSDFGEYQELSEKHTALKAAAGALLDYEERKALEELL